MFWQLINHKAFWYDRYILGSVATTAMVNYYLAIKVALARKEYGVPYPAAYAEGTSDNAIKFNCVQRSHQSRFALLLHFLKGGYAESVLE